MTGVSVVRCGQCKAACIGPPDYNYDSLDLVPHQPWCPQVQPTRPIVQPLEEASR